MSNDKVKITAETLKNGDVLCALIVRFIHNRNEANMMSVLHCLRDSNVFMAADVAVSNEGGAPTEPIILVKRKVMIKPKMLVAADGYNYVPIFSREINSKAGLLKDAQLVNLPYLKCIEMLNEMDDCRRFVVDPFLYNFVLTENLIDISSKLPSKLDS